MPGTIDVSVVLQVVNGLFNDQFTPQNQSLPQTNVGVVGGTDSIDTSDDIIPHLNGLISEGWCVLQNLDSTNYVVWGPDNGSGVMVVAGKLKPGEFCLFRVAPGVVLHAQADTDHVLLFSRIYED